MGKESRILNLSGMSTTFMMAMSALNQRNKKCGVMPQSVVIEGRKNVSPYQISTEQ